MNRNHRERLGSLEHGMLALAAALLVLALTLAGCGAVSDSAGGGRTGKAGIHVLSNRADLISGGDALVEITGEVPTKVTLNGADISSAFAMRPNGRFMGLVTGLALGANELVAAGQRITITNHPIGGPVFSGPQIQPWPCREGAQDAQCNRPVSYAWHYMPAGGGALADYDPANPPADVGTTTTDEGKTVPYIVREEIGVLDRSEYRIASLHDPSKPFEPWAPQDGWNRKLVITHGSGCDTTYGQGSAPDVLMTSALSRGFAVMSHALDHNTQNCNVVLQGESLVMTKERVVETLGEIRYTIGSGCSGGAVAQYQMANAYPGLYQGITPQCSFPDSWSSRMLYEDYSLLRGYFENPGTWDPGVAWSTEEIEAVWGHPNPANARVYNTAIAPVIDPSRSCPGVPTADVYDPVNNPDGVRCSLQDFMVNVLGRRGPEVWTSVEQQLGRGFAGKPWDNVGVQYGYKALMAGKLSAAQFTDLNDKVGGRGIDYDYQRERFAGDEAAIRAVYRSGAFNMANNLNQTAIIDLRGPDPGAFHDVYRTYAARARLEREHGTAANQLVWRGPIVLLGDATFVEEGLLAMDRWLAAAEQDTRAVPYSQKLVDNRPADVDHRCTNGSGEDVPAAQCDAVVQAYSTARIEAGMPYTDDVAKCQLKPLLASDYFPVFFTPEQWARLQQTFPTGVCDYSVPGVGQQGTIPWAPFADGPGGEPLGPPPVSRPF
jgi:hypothetical protein